MELYRAESIHNEIQRLCSEKHEMHAPFSPKISTKNMKKIQFKPKNLEFNTDAHLLSQVAINGSANEHGGFILTL